MPESGADIAPHRGRATAPQGQPRTPTPTCGSPNPAQPPQPPRNPVPRSTDSTLPPRELDAVPSFLLACVPSTPEADRQGPLTVVDLLDGLGRHDQVAVVRRLRARGLRR